MRSPVSLTLFWTEKVSKQLDFPQRGVMNLTWLKLLSLFLISSLRDEMGGGGGIRGVRRMKTRPCKGAGSRQGRVWLEQTGGWQTLAQHRCPVGWSLASESPRCISPGLEKSCFIHITPLSYRSLGFFSQMLTVSISRNGLYKGHLANMLSWVFFLHGLSIPLVLTKLVNHLLGIKSREQRCLLKDIHMHIFHRIIE